MSKEDYWVDLGERSYPIVIEPNFNRLSEWLEERNIGKRVIIITNDTVGPLYLDLLKQQLSAYEVDSITIPDGEKYKSLDTYHQVMTQLIEKGCQRNVTLIALGGGVVGDLTGFVAASYQRGVPFIQIPTTLLSQVDSSVGGKTAINHSLGKNLIGAFYQPRLVYINTATLNTLPAREFCAGLSEVIKYGVIKDSAFFDWLEDNSELLLEKNAAALNHAIESSCKIKANVVKEDETEKGMRAILNFGHTFGHALELWYGYERYLHGEAVAIGMSLATTFSVHNKWVNSDVLMRLKALLTRCQLPVSVPETINGTKLLQLMKRDKKNLSQNITLVLPKRIGHVDISDAFNDSDIELFLTAVLQNDEQ